MRNLKRALSLGLTAAMISGLMVMGSSAASYADVTSENNVEAIEVLEAVGIMIGDENGNFNPDQNVTRNEMAVVMSNLMEYNVASYKDTSPFTDVPSWAEPYVAACWTNGITAGYSDTIYGGSDTVTTAQAALMLMKALGYFQYASDFGGDWQLATTRQGNAIDLFTGVDSGVEQAMTRNDVAQLVLNTLRSGTVEASTDGSWTIGDVTINNNVQYSYITSNADYADAIDDVKSTSNTTDANRYVVELGEQLYQGDLELNDNATDVFGRPARTWSYDSKEIGTYAKTELLKQSYTTKVTGRELYDLLGSNVVDNYNIKVAIDGVIDHDINGNIFNETAINRNNKAAVGATGNGVLTEVYVDQEAKDVYISVINTYLAIADEDYDAEQDELGITVYGITEVDNTDEYIKNADSTDGTSAGQTEKFDLAYEDFALEDVVEDDVLMVTVANGAVQTVADPETLGGVEISAFRQGKNLTVDGTTYDYATTTEYECETLEDYTTDGGVTNLKDLTYNVYLDAYGYVLGVVEVDAVDNYVFLTGVDSNYSNLSNTTLTANAIFLDGTMATIEIDMRKSTLDIDNSVRDAVLNTWCTYSVNSSDIYTVTEVYNPDPLEATETAQMGKYGQYWDQNLTDVDDDHIWIQGEPDEGTPYYRVYGNDESIYLNVSIDEITVGNWYGGSDIEAVVIDDVNSVVTGIDNANMEVFSEAEALDEVGNDGRDGLVSYGVYPLYDDEAYVIAAIVVGEDGSNSENLVYVHSGSVYEESYDKTTEEYTWTRTVISNGEEVTLTEVDDSGISLLANGRMDEGKWYQVRYNADGEVIKVEADQTNVAGWLDYDHQYDEWSLSNYEGSDRYTNTLDTVYSTADGSVLVWGAADLYPMEGVDTVLYHEYFNVPGLPTVDKARTLYEYNTTTSGIRIATDASIILDQERNKDGGEVYFGTGVDDLIDFLEDLHKRTNGNYEYDLSMVIEDGRATTVIIKDHVEDGDAGNWTESNMIQNENVILWGSDNTSLITLATAGVGANFATNTISFTFTGLDADGDKIVSDKVLYDVDVYVNGHHDVYRDDVVGFADANGKIAGTVTPVSANATDEVVVRISNVRLAKSAPTTDVTLTLSGNAKGAKVYAPQIETADVTGFGFTEYNLTKGDTVTVEFTTGSLTVGEQYEVDGVVATAVANNAIRFIIASDMEISDVPSNAIIAITAGEGITLTDADGNKATNGGFLTVNANENFTVESETGEYLAINSTSQYLHGNGVAEGTTSVTESTTFYAATSVSFGTGVTATYKDLTDGSTVTLTSTTSPRDVAAGTKLTLAVTGGSAVIDSADDVADEAYTTTYEVGLTAGNLKAAWQVNLKGIASIETSAGDEIADGAYVASTETIAASTAEDADGNTVHVLDVSAGNTYGAEATTIALSGVSKNVVLSAATKITVTNGSGISVELEDADGNVEIAKDGATETILVLAGERLLIKDNDKAVVAEDVDGNPITLETLGNHPTWAKYTVGSVDITLDDAT